MTRSTRSVAVAPSLSRPVRRKPTTSGRSIEIGWPSIAASASIPPTPQPTTPRPLIIVVWRIGADQRVREQPLAVVPDHVGQILEVDLMDDSGGRRDDPEVGEGPLAPFEELVPLLVPLELPPDC